MAGPTPIGRIHYNEPRAVVVRDPEEETGMHAAISGTVNVYTNTVTERQKVLESWSEIAQAISLKVEEIIGRA